MPRGESMTLSEYTDGLRDKRTAVVGIGISNTPLIRLLAEKGCRVTACDRRSREALGGVAEELEALGVGLRLGDGYLDGLDADVIFRTPGMRPDLPQIADAVARGAALTSEMEAFFDVCPCEIIAVTGSDGKTTTTTLISELLRAQGYTVHLGGNIGTPLLCRADDMAPDDVAVVELSSFQLMTMKKSPRIAVVTNVAPNHLDIHRDMDEYVDAKRNVFRSQGEDGLVVLNLDNDITRGFAAEANGQVAFFSRRQRVENGVYCEDGAIYDARGGKAQRVLDVAGIKIPGVHNIENYMAAYAAVRDMVTPETLRRVAGEFGGVEHRIELVRTLRGVRYYNDSIASSPSRTTAGLRSFTQKVILIAGGKDKGVPFDSLGAEIIAHVKKLVLTGLTADKIRAAVEGAPGYSGEPEIFTVPDFRDAVVRASELAEEGDVVILSPACTSFDRFRNFEERGNYFKEIVNGLE